MASVWNRRCASLGTSISPPSEPRPIRRIGVWIALAATGLAGLGAATIASPWLRVRTVEVSGADHLSTAHVVRVSGVRTGQSLVLLRPGEIADRLEADPWIAEATVERDLPTTLRIAVRERSPVAAVRKGSGYQELAADGTVLGTPTGRPALPVIVPAAGRGIGPAVSALGAMTGVLRDQVRAAIVAVD